MKIPFSGKLSRLVFLAVLASASLPLGAQTALSGVTLLQPADPMFRETLDAQFPGVSSLAGFDSIQPFLVILTSSDAFSKKAYAVRWTISYTAGFTQNIDRITIRQPFERFTRALTPKQVRLVSPPFSLSTADYHRMRDVFQSLFPAEAFPRPANVSGITAVLDGVVSEDGTFSGTNATGLKTHYACFARAEIDEGTLMSQFAAAPATDNARNLFAQQIKAGLAAEGKPDPASLHASYLGDLAQQFNNLLNKPGFTTAALGGRARTLLSMDKYTTSDCSI